MEEKIKVEKQFLYETEELIQDLLEKHMETKSCKLDAFSKAKIKQLVNRVINQEVDYLHEDPDNYFEIYGQDHLKN